MVEASVLFSILSIATNNIFYCFWNFVYSLHYFGIFANNISYDMHGIIIFKGYHGSWINLIHFMFLFLDIATFTIFPIPSCESQERHIFTRGLSQLNTTIATVGVDASHQWSHSNSNNRFMNTSPCCSNLITSFLNAKWKYNSIMVWLLSIRFESFFITSAVGYYIPIQHNDVLSW